MYVTYTAHNIIAGGYFAAAVELMDDEIREDLNRELAPCTDEEFMAAYMAAHLAKYGEPFTI